MQSTGTMRAVLATAIILSLPIVGIGEIRAQGSMQMPPDAANVLIIVLDDIGVDQIGCYWENYPGPEDPIPSGWEPVPPRTPNIDALAAAGTRFTNAWSSPVCSPTRAQIMTGMRASQTGMGTAFNRSHDTWPGLATTGTGLGSFAPSAAVGKWHLAVESQQPSHPCSLGFGSFLGTFYNVNPQGDASIGCDDSSPFMCWNRFDCGSTGPEEIENYATAQTTEDAITKMNELDAGSAPWLLYVAYHASHAPYHCPPEELYGNETGWLESCSDDIANGQHDPRVYQTRAMTQALDIEIGELLSELDMLDGTADGIYENTAVILISDNGTPREATIAPFRVDHAKATVYQGGINVPLIIRAPSLDPSVGPTLLRVSNELVSATDVYATTQHFLTGMAASPQVDANSVAALVDDDYGTFEPRTNVYSESFSPNFNRTDEEHLPHDLAVSSHLRAVRDARYKLIDTWGPQNTRNSWKFYCLYDPSLGRAPQDPADLDATGPMGEMLFREDRDLLTDDQESWPDDALASYAALAELLNTTYPPLPGGADTAVLALSTNGTDCDEISIYVSSNGSDDISRAFLEFEIPLNVAEVYSAHLSVAVMEAGSDASRTLKVWPVLGTVSQIPCGILFVSIDGTPYSEVGGWTGENFAKVIHLGGSAKDHILGASGDLFSVALTLGDESEAYSVRLDPIYSQNPPAEHRLILRYRTSAGQQMMAEIPATPARENKLSQSYPNPFNPTATIAYAVKEPSHVSLHVYDVSGALVRTLVDRAQPAGDGYKVVWDGRNDAGQPVSSGVYFYRLTVGDFVDSKKMIMLK